MNFRWVNPYGAPDHVCRHRWLYPNLWYERFPCGLCLQDENREVIKEFLAAHPGSSIKNIVDALVPWNDWKPFFKMWIEYHVKWVHTIEAVGFDSYRLRRNI